MMDKARVIELANDAGITFIKPFGVASATSEWLERFAALIEAEVRGDSEPVAWLDLLKAAEETVRGKSVWKRYIDGTLLSNDIAVWMADFAQEYVSPAPAASATVTLGRRTVSLQPGDSLTLDAEPVAWLYDFVVDGAVVKDWTTIDKATAYSAADGCHNQRPLYLHP